MFRLSAVSPEDLGGGISVLDLGASGGPSGFWRPLTHLVKFTGFDPNAEECLRLEGISQGYLSQRYLPYAIGGRTEKATLYLTQSPYCWSLLSPNLPWLRRFVFSDLFEVTAAKELSVWSLAEIPELEGMEIDAMKLDTQGLELPILSSAERIAMGCIAIETETGFTENYIGESTFDQVARFMRDRGFGLFGLNADHRVPRRSKLADESTNEQLLWCEAVWLRDYWLSDPALEPMLTREKALRALCIYGGYGCISFGLEAARRFADLGLLTGREYDELASGPEAWRLQPYEKPSPAKRVLKAMLRLLGRRLGNAIGSALHELE